MVSDRVVTTMAAKAWNVLETVPDPEIPALSVVDLGIVRDVIESADGRAVTVTLTPTYSGCPATEVIARDVRADANDLPIPNQDGAVFDDAFCDGVNLGADNGVGRRLLGVGLFVLGRRDGGEAQGQRERQAESISSHTRSSRR